MTRITPYRLVACLLAAGLCAAAAPPATQPSRPTKPIDYQRGTQIATLAHKRLDESSGMAASRKRADVFWTHNDSGDKPRLYAMNRAGAHLGTFKIPGAAHRDWEDMASFTLDGVAYLLIADIGDNDERRTQCRLYITPEPTPATTTQPAIKPRVVRTITFRYPDGAHDCEAIAVDATRREVYLITKARRPVARVYRVPLPSLKPTTTAPKATVVVARPVAAVGLVMATAMDISPDGRRMIVATYGDAFQYTRDAGETWDQALTRQGSRVALPTRRQGEAICYGRDGKTLYATSEKRPAPLIEIKPVAEGNQPQAD